VTYAVVGMFLAVRFLDTFVIMPLTVGRSIRMHPLPTVLMLFIGGTVAGVAGLILAIPLAGVVSAIVGTIGAIIEDPRLRARHRFGKALEAKRVNADLG
jgi:predicted PurR-regulated permease PerM